MMAINNSDTDVIRWSLFLFVFIVVLIEAAWLKRVKHQSYDWRATGASFGIAFGKRVIDTATAGVIAALLFWVYEYRAFTIELTSIWNIGLLFFLVEFTYYWRHRLSHQILWLWATHAVHHSPNEMNFSVAARLGWTNLISGSVLFIIPLVWLGFHPLAVLLMFAANLFYQLWLHTELIKKLPRPVEWLFNTPSHHRVHHASNPQYLDRNYGGVLIIWDRLFGTFAEEVEAPKYGLTEPIKSYNPIKIAFWEWAKMVRNLRDAKSIADAARHLFGPPRALEPRGTEPQN